MGVRISTFTAAAAAALASHAALGAGGVPQPDVCDRDCWDARPPAGSISQMSGLNRAVIHHTAVSAAWDTTSLEESKAYVRGVQNYHMDVNGWTDIGYHFLGDKLGNLFEGREGSLTSLPRGAHDGVNDASMGFSMMGYFHEPYDQEPTEEIRCAIYRAIAWKVPDPFTGFGSGLYNGATEGFVAGHRDVGSTVCPGDLMYDTYIGTDFYAGEAREEIHALVTTGEGLMCAGQALCCPGAPTLDSVIVTPDGVALRWSDAGDVLGYEVEITVDADGIQTEATVELGAGETRWVDRDAAPGQLRTYTVRAVGTRSTSDPSDAYSARVLARGSTVLVVDGNDRWLSQPENPGHTNHAFAALTGAATPADVGFDTVDNASVISGRISLAAYDAVVWSLGEESTRDETFSDAEQLAVETFLNQGGRLFVSGAEVGWDLYAQGSASDQAFFTYKLHAAWVADDAGQTDASPEAGGIFDGLPPLDFSGGPMIVDYPDVIAPGADASPALYYTRTTAGDAQDRFAAITYDGASRVVYLGFPFESITDEESRQLVMARSLDFLGVVGEDGAGDEIHVEDIRVDVAGRGRVRAVARVFVANGRGRPVDDVLVVGTFSGDVGLSAEASTGHAGVATLTTEPAKVAAPSFTFCVDALQGDGLTWDRAEDAARCATYEPTP